MPRFLIPSRVGLLALIAIYTESLVPSKAIVPILSFLCSHVLAKGLPAESGGAKHEGFVVGIEGLQRATLDQASGTPGRTIWDVLLARLWNINCLSALHQSFDDLSFLLEKRAETLGREKPDPAPKRIPLSPHSPLGLFVRRAQVEFTRLPFLDGIALWTAFVAYREPTLLQWKKRNPTAGVSSFDVNLPDKDTYSDVLTDLLYPKNARFLRTRYTISTGDVERLLQIQVERMQKRGSRLPIEVKTAVREMLQGGVRAPVFSYYVQSLDSWRAGNYPAAFSNLHRYFDYTAHNRDRDVYQYALLNMALLHADFGSYSEALDAMQETIATARENRDVACLTYCLSWLYHFGKAHPKWMSQIKQSGMLGTERETLSFLKFKAKDNHMWSMLSTTLLSEAKLTLINGEDVSLAFENVLKASHINLVKNVPNAVSSQMATQMSLFGRLGMNYQASLTGQIFQQCYSSASSLEDGLHALCNSANLLALQGRYTEAIDQMEAIDEEGTRLLHHQSYRAVRLGLLKFYQQLFRTQLVAAREILNRVRATAEEGSESFLHIGLSEIDLLTREGNYSRAMAVLEDLASRVEKEEADMCWRIKVMIVKARILEMAGTPQKGFSVSLRAANLAWTCKILPLLWESVAALCAVLNSVKEYDASSKLLESVLPQALECEDCGLIARIFSLTADCHVGMAGEAEAGSVQRKDRLSRALENLERAFDHFIQLEDVRGQCEMLAKKATIMHLNGELELADDCAAKYLSIKDATEENFGTF